MLLFNGKLESGTIHTTALMKLILNQKPSSHERSIDHIKGPTITSNSTLHIRCPITSEVRQSYQRPSLHIRGPPHQSHHYTSEGPLYVRALIILEPPHHIRVPSSNQIPFNHAAPITQFPLHIRAPPLGSSSVAEGVRWRR